MGDVVGAIVELMGAVAAALSQHKRVGQGSCTGADVHWGTAGEVEATELVDPAGRVPRPACDGVVDHGRPNEGEDHGWG